MLLVWPKEKADCMYFSCAFVLKTSSLPTSAILKIAGKHSYRVHVGKHFVASGPSRCAHGYCEYDVLPIGRYSDGNDAVITVEMCSFNLSIISDTNDRPCFGAEITDGNTVLFSTADFRCYELTDLNTVVPRYSWQRHFVECYDMKHCRAKLYPGNTCEFPELACKRVESYRLSERNVSYPTYEIMNATSMCMGSVHLDHNAPPYYDRFLYEVGNNGYDYNALEDPVVETARCLTYHRHSTKPSNRSFELFDLDKNKSGFIMAELEVLERSRILILWDEVLNDQGFIDPLRMRMANMIRLDLNAGIFNFESFEPYTMRYIKVVILNGSARINGVRLRLFENPDCNRFKYDFANKEYTELLDAAVSTFAQNAVDLLTDCPSRERAAWLCDSYFSGAAEKLFTGSNKVEAHFLDNYAKYTPLPYFPKQILPMTYPGEFVNRRYIPNWNMWYILEVYEHYKRTGDRSVAESSKHNVLSVLQYFQGFENEYGLLEDLSGWVFVEWSRANDFTDGVNFPTNMLYHAALLAAAGLYGDTYGFQARASKLKEHLIRLSLNGGLFFRDHAVRNEDGKLVVIDETSETCQYYAFYFGFATAQSNPQLLDTLLSQFRYDRDDTTVFPKVYKSNAFIGNILRVAYLSNNGYAREALEQVVSYYHYMSKTTGTLWEYQTSHKSCCHCFASYIAIIILKATVGYVGTENGRVIFTTAYLHEDCCVTIPLSPSLTATVTVKNGKRTVVSPDGFEAVMI